MVDTLFTRKLSALFLLVRSRSFLCQLSMEAARRAAVEFAPCGGPERGEAKGVVAEFGRGEELMLLRCRRPYPMDRWACQITTRYPDRQRAPNMRIF
jgi:hypothetical protein